jgi:hypothetical protein
MSIENEYFSRLISKTKRDDAVLLTRYGPLDIPAAASAELLTALWAVWPSGHFDETNISTMAPRNPRLLRALRFLPAKTRQYAGGRALLQKNERDVLRWILTVEGLDIGGLRLERDPFGWCDIAFVGEARQRSPPRSSLMFTAVTEMFHRDDQSTQVRGEHQCL